MRVAVLAASAALALCACEKRDPVADQANNAATAPAEVDVLPPDESVATPTNELEGGDDEDVNVSDAEDKADPIPAAFHGRWALTPRDCTSPNGDTKGLLVVSADRLRFYESLATPSGDLKRTPDSVSGDFAFSGEGMRWKKYEALEIQGNKLVRTESDPIRSYTYARCTS
jgi:hypothetical protein